MEARDEEEEGAAGSSATSKDVIGVIILVIVANIAIVCIYRHFQKKNRQSVMRDVVNKEVSRYFKIATSESGANRSMSLD